MREALGPQREAVVAREITKAFETVYRGTLHSAGGAMRKRIPTRRAARS